MAWLDPTSRVMANGGSTTVFPPPGPIIVVIAGVESVSGDVAVGDGLDAGDDVGTGMFAEEVGVSALNRQVLLDRGSVADRGHGGDLAVLGLEDGKEAGLLGQPCHTDRVGRGGAPAQRARHEDVQVAGAADVHGPLDLGLEVVEVGDGGSGDVGDVMGHGQAGEVLPLAEDVARLDGPPPRSSPSGPPAAWPRNAGRPCSCRPRCRSR